MKTAWYIGRDMAVLLFLKHQSILGPKPDTVAPDRVIPDLPDVSVVNVVGTAP